MSAPAIVPTRNTAMPTSGLSPYFPPDPLVLTWRIGIFILMLQGAQHLFIHIPVFQDFDDHPGAESGLHERSEYSCRIFFILRLFQSLAPQEGTRLLLFVHSSIGLTHRFFDYITVHAFDFEISNHPAWAELLIFFAE